MKEKDSRAALLLLVRTFERAQQPDGGWGHDDASRFGQGGQRNADYPHTFTAASQCVLGALCAAERALGVKQSVAIGRGRDYLVAEQNGGGTFPYQPSQCSKAPPAKSAAPTPGDIEDVARSSGAAYALVEAGASVGDPAVTSAMAAIDGHMAWLSESHRSATFGLEYAALLAYVRGGDDWTRFRAEFFPRILAAQAPEGWFACVCRCASPGTSCDTSGETAAAYTGEDAAIPRDYVTSIHLLILALDRGEAMSLPKYAPPPK